MPAGIGAAGVIGLAEEVTPGTYVVPAKFVPVRSESLQAMQEINYTRPIIKTAVEPVHAVKGPLHIAGAIEWEVLHDVMPYFMRAGRYTEVKAGVGPYTYTYTPAATAQEANSTLSITVERNGEAFGYVGCVLAGMTLTVDNGMLVGTMNIMGRDEATQSSPAVTIPQTPPLGADTYDIEIPSASPITDAGSFSFEVDESAEAQFRLGSLAARYIGYGERNISVEIERDFIDRTEYDLFKALTAQSIHLRSEDQVTATNYIDILVDSGVMDTYEAFLEGQGDIITAALSFTGKYDFAGSRSHVIEIGTAENLA
ncbi:MAG: phage tail tube protein [Candidatus Thorarchaeota archaeon]|jgi:hypothetical protein